MSKRKSAVGVLLAMGLGVVGCGSVVYRLDLNPFSSVEPGIYPGVRTDIDIIYEAADPSPWFPGSPHFAPDPYAVTFWTIIFTLDMPLSGVCDTLFLPYDLFAGGSKPHQDTSDATVQGSRPD